VTRYVGELRWRFVGDAQLAQSFIPHARKVVGLLHETSPGIQTNRITRKVTDGVTVTVWHWMSQITAEIDVRALESKRTKSAVNGVWVPKGFVVYPVSDESPKGWGVPVIQREKNDDGEDIGPWDKENLAPGLDVTRWTPGGAWGQVLLSKVPNAGYPEGRGGRPVAPVPLLFHRQFGPKITEYREPPMADSYAAYRVELSDYAGDSWCHRCFDLTNELRVGDGCDPFVPPPKWMANIAKITTDMEARTRFYGHSAEGFWPTWRSAHTRLFRDIYDTTSLPSGAITSDAFGGEVLAAGAPPPGGSWDVIGVDEGGWPIIEFSVPPPSKTPEEAVADWDGSPPHRALLTSVWFDLADGVSHGTTQIGHTSGLAAQLVYPLSTWIGGGNRWWRSKHDEIPMLSWRGFASLNTGFETMPVGLATTGADPFTFVEPLLHTPDDFIATHYVSRMQRAMSELSGVIFARGRAIAMAPRRGVVLAAAIRKVEDPNSPPTYQLVALVHHDEDQPMSAIYGVTAYLRVWEADLPKSGPLAANPMGYVQYPQGEEEPQGYPWAELDSPLSWTGGHLVDVGTLGGGPRDLLMYASQWVFNSAGTRAICMRANDTYWNYALGRPGVGEYVAFTGRYTSALELRIDTPGQVPEVIRYPRPPCALNPKYGCVTGSASTFYGGIVAAGYDEDDNPKFCFRWTLETGAGDFTNGLLRPRLAYFMFSTDYYYEAGCNDRFSMIGYHHAVRKEPTGAEYNDSNYAGYFFQVLDVKDEVIVQPCVSPINQLKYYGEGLYILEPNPDTAIEWWGNPEAAKQKVRAWRNGVLLGEQQYALDGKVCRNNSLEPGLFNYNIGMGLVATIWHAIFTLSSIVRANYAVSGGDWLLSYSVEPQPTTMIVPSSTLGLPQVNKAKTIIQAVSDGDIADIPGSFGGYSYSSFATHEELVELTQTPGDLPHFSYVYGV